MGDEISKIGGSHNYYKTTQELKDAMKETGLTSFGTEGKRKEVIFGEGGLEAGATKEDFIDKMEEIGLNEDIAQACWDVLNIDTEGDSLGVIDEDELDKLLEMFGSDANGEELDEIDKITLGSLYTKLDSADKVDETDEVDESDNNNSAIKTESNTSTETDSPDLLGSLVQGFKDGFNFLFNLTPINFLSSLFGGNSSTQSNQTNQNSLGNVITSAVSEEVAEVAEPLKKTLVDGLLDGAKTLISGLFSKK